MCIRICVIGCGNITNSRHIPAIKVNKTAVISGLIGIEKERIERTKNKWPSLRATPELLIDNSKSIFAQLEKTEWFKKEVDAVIIGTPPKQHFNMVEACLRLGKHVLVEKPMMMSPDECDRVISISKENKLVLGVMHSFQFSNGFRKLDALIKEKKLGEIKSILELQLSNRARRLPSWYNELPLGLFYDEAAHFFYTARRFGGKLDVMNASAVFNNDDNTPRMLQAQIIAGDIPVQMYMNFNSPICEWGVVIVGDDKIAMYDYFKDILVVLKNDGQHYAKDVLRTSVFFTVQFWKGFLLNGFRMITGRLLYGHDLCIHEFVKAIQEKRSICFELSPELGREVVQAMNYVVDFSKK